jgi:hypothetical protein
VHPKIVSERLGHATVSLRLDTYSHVLPSLGQEAAETVADLIFGPNPDGRSRDDDDVSDGLPTGSDDQA